MRRTGKLRRTWLSGNREVVVGGVEERVLQLHQEMANIGGLDDGSTHHELCRGRNRLARKDSPTCNAMSHGT